MSNLVGDPQHPAWTSYLSARLGMLWNPPGITERSGRGMCGHPDRDCSHCDPNKQGKIDGKELHEPLVNSAGSPNWTLVLKHGSCIEKTENLC